MSAERTAALAAHALPADAPASLPPMERALWCLRRSNELAKERRYERAAYWCGRAAEHFGAAGTLPHLHPAPRQAGHSAPAGGAAAEQLTSEPSRRATAAREHGADFTRCEAQP